MREMFVYAVDPIDSGWKWLSTVEEVAAKIAANDASVRALFMDDFKDATALALRAGWQGDFREAPRVWWLPASMGFEHGFAWKQDQKGMTFVVSPVALPWLKPYG